MTSGEERKEPTKVEEARETPGDELPSFIRNLKDKGYDVLKVVRMPESWSDCPTYMVKAEDEGGRVLTYEVAVPAKGFEEGGIVLKEVSWGDLDGYKRHYLELYRAEIDPEIAEWIKNIRNVSMRSDEEIEKMVEERGPMRMNIENEVLKGGGMGIALYKLMNVFGPPNWDEDGRTGLFDYWMEYKGHTFSVMDEYGALVVWHWFWERGRESWEATDEEKRTTEEFVSLLKRFVETPIPMHLGELLELHEKLVKI